VLLAIGRDEIGARGGVRFSLGTDTTAAEIDAAAAAVQRVVGLMRAVANCGAEAGKASASTGSAW
jgi:cysteine sulfinate desulfinase/cysteine desulfurase-like protein